MLKPALLTTLALAIAAPAMATDAFSPGHNTLARIAGVDPAMFTTADLQRLIQAQREGDQAKVNHILNTTFAPGEVISITYVPGYEFDTYAEDAPAVGRAATVTN
ncbi:hypothetical protein [Pseudoruegeria sp. SHC-113]|uniref:hypothetical protein n=1 Tax=Pseudoruegeria sp. SHC-113 TaxID=2855439 RepID=UPI0021BB0547|nr:hypothetical protein [Pseudoruegeria sp. SHC-113]MCT8160752.1 hypothetical protein [Pseudoruegeria sp. SHC-113]